MRTATPPPPPPSADHLLVSVDGGPWQSTTASLRLPAVLVPEQTQRIGLAVHNPTGSPVTIATSVSLGDWAITAPGIDVRLPSVLGADATETGAVTITTPSWQGEAWLGRTLDATVTVRASTDEPAAAALPFTGVRTPETLLLAAVLLASGMVSLLVAGRTRRRRGHAA